MMKDKICIGLIGLGTVGSGVVDILRRNGELIKRRLGVPIEIKKYFAKTLENLCLQGSPET